MSSESPQPWETRSGEQLENMGPQKGEDLAALQRRQNALKRDRAAIAKQNAAAQQDRTSRLEERARLERIKEIILSRMFLMIAGAVAVLAIAFAVIWSATHQNASQENFQNTLPQMSLQAVRQLGTDASPKVTELPEAWRVEFTVPAGAITVDDQITIAACGVAYLVGKDQPSQKILKWSTIAFKPCRSRAR